MNEDVEIKSRNSYFGQRVILDAVEFYTTLSQR